MVKKIKADGSPCRKCADVEQRLEAANLSERIDHVVVADERDPNSEGMRLARKYQVEQAPFFVVESDDGTEKIYTIYFQLLKEVLSSKF